MIYKMGIYRSWPGTENKKPDLMILLKPQAIKVYTAGFSKHRIPVLSSTFL